MGGYENFGALGASVQKMSQNATEEAGAVCFNKVSESDENKPGDPLGT